MSTYAEGLLSRFRSKGTLVDTNLLLLLLIGSYDRTLIGERGFKRVAKYTLEDFGVLVLLLKQFSKCVTTPHILTEVCNLAGQLPDHHKSKCFGTFVQAFRDFVEIPSSSFVAAARREFPYLGLTDCVIAESAHDFLIVTDDLRFWSALSSAGVSALNFNHIRTLGWR